MGEPNYQLTKDFKHRINKLILSAFPNQLWCIDLIDWSQLYKRHRGNQGYRYIVNVVDVFSRKIWIEKMKNKEAEITHDIGTGSYCRTCRRFMQSISFRPRDRIPLRLYHLLQVTKHQTTVQPSLFPIRKWNRGVTSQ